jgi:hypothetical protein
MAWELLRDSHGTVGHARGVQVLKAPWHLDAAL